MNALWGSLMLNHLQHSAVGGGLNIHLKVIDKFGTQCICRKSINRVTNFGDLC